MEKWVCMHVFTHWTCKYLTKVSPSELNNDHKGGSNAYSAVRHPSSSHWKHSSTCRCACFTNNRPQGTKRQMTRQKVAVRVPLWGPIHINRSCALKIFQCSHEMPSTHLLAMCHNQETDNLISSTPTHFPWAALIFFIYSFNFWLYLFACFFVLRWGLMGLERWSTY